MKVGLSLFLVFMFLSAGCATTTYQQAQTSSLLGAIGAGAGAALDGGNRWRGALIGGLAGMATGYGLATINQQPYAGQPLPPAPSTPPAQPRGSYYNPGPAYYQPYSQYPQAPYGGSQYQDVPSGYHSYRAPYCVYCY